MRKQRVTIPAGYVASLLAMPEAAELKRYAREQRVAATRRGIHHDVALWGTIELSLADAIEAAQTHELAQPNPPSGAAETSN